MAHSQPIPNDSRPSSSPIDARFGRTQASSSSGDCAEGDEEGARPFSISCVKYRVGAPALRLLPMESFYHVNPLHKVMDDEDAARRLALQVEEDARCILTERRIIDPPAEGEEDVDFRVKLIERAMSEVPESAEPTLMIEAPWSEGSSDVIWQDAVRDLKKRLDKTLSQQGLGDKLDVTVEMCAPELTRDKMLGVIEGQPALTAAWPRLSRDMSAKLADDYPDIWWCIECFSLFRLGYDLRNNANNPITVYIAVSYDSNELNWPPAIAALEKLLAEAGWSHIQVHMEHGEPATHLGLWA